MQIDLTGRTALVTGAARGIGQAIARKLAASGASVILSDMDETALDENRKAITQSGGKAAIVTGDLTKPDIPSQIIQTAVDRFGSLDIVVNNAGYTWDNVIQKTTDEQFQAMLDIHVTAPFRILRAASEFIRLAAKREKADGILVTRKVVNITSISGIDGNPGQAGYSSGKAAIVGLTKTLAKEWGRYNVTVNAVGFGLIDTRLIKPIGDPQTEIDIGERHVRVGMQAEVRNAATAQIPLGRIGTPDDAANAVFFFCSPLSDYITGEVLICSGGAHF
ncbi:MAG TPA: SDR family NAD(P)-dependent oxidoreductase [Bryobacteraceae bacterium]|nr:SDR family NAD(P)-dependent oxidoreductase [Bryobacteraceae bacterium]